MRINTNEEEQVQDPEEEQQPTATDEATAQAQLERTPEEQTFEAFYSRLSRDAEAGVVNNLPDFDTFTKAFGNEEYRKQFHGYMLRGQSRGNFRGIPRDFEDFTKKFAPIYYEEPEDTGVGAQAGTGERELAENSTSMLGLLDEQGLDAEFMQEVMDADSLNSQMITELGNAGKSLRQRQEQILRERDNEYRLHYQSATTDEDVNNYLSTLKNEADSLDEQIFTAYSTLQSELNNVREQRQSLEETRRVRSGLGMMNPTSGQYMREETLVPTENKEAHARLLEKESLLEEKIEELKPSPWYRVRSAVNQFVKSGTVQPTADMLEGIALLSNDLERLTKAVVGKGKEPVDGDIQELATWQWAQSVRELGEQLFPTDRTLQEDFLTTMLPAGLGSFGSYAGAGLGARALTLKAGRATTALAGTQGMSQAYNEAKALGASEADSQLAGRWGFIPGVAQVLPVMRLLDRFDKAVGGQLKNNLRNVIKEGFKGSFEEALMEGVGQGGFDLIARGIYDEERDLVQSMQSIGNASGMGGLIGFIANAITVGATRGSSKQMSMQRLRDQGYEVQIDENGTLVVRRRPGQDDGDDDGTPPPTSPGAVTVPIEGEDGGEGGEINGEGLSISWNNDAPVSEQINEIETQIEVMQSLADQYREEGQDPTDIETLIESARGAISELGQGTELYQRVNRVSGQMSSDSETIFDRGENENVIRTTDASGSTVFEVAYTEQNNVVRIEDLQDMETGQRLFSFIDEALQRGNEVEIGPDVQLRSRLQTGLRSMENAGYKIERNEDTRVVDGSLQSADENPLMRITSLPDPMNDPLPDAVPQELEDTYRKIAVANRGSRVNVLTRDGDQGSFVDQSGTVVGDGGREYQFTFRDADGQRTGAVVFSETQDTVNLSLLAGTGAGARTAKHVIDYALRNGKRFESDSSVNERLVQGVQILERMGYEVQMAPDSDLDRREYTGGNSVALGMGIDPGKGQGYYRNTKNKPVFTVTGGPMLSIQQEATMESDAEALQQQGMERVTGRRALALMTQANNRMDNITVDDLVGTTVTYGDYRGRLSMDERGDYIVTTSDGTEVIIPESQGFGEEPASMFNISDSESWSADLENENQINIESINPATGQRSTGTAQLISINENDTGDIASLTIEHENGQRRTIRQPGLIEQYVLDRYFVESANPEAEMNQAIDEVLQESQETQTEDVPDTGVEQTTQTPSEPEQVQVVATDNLSLQYSSDGRVAITDGARVDQIYPVEQQNEDGSTTITFERIIEGESQQGDVAQQPFVTVDQIEQQYPGLIGSINQAMPDVSQMIGDNPVQNVLVRRVQRDSDGNVTNIEGQITLAGAQNIRFNVPVIDGADTAGLQEVLAERFPEADSVTENVQPGLALDDGDPRLTPVFRALDNGQQLTRREQEGAFAWINDKLSQIENAQPDNTQELLDVLAEFEQEIIENGPDPQSEAPNLEESESEITDEDEVPVTQPGPEDESDSQVALVRQEYVESIDDVHIGLFPETAINVIDGRYRMYQGEDGELVFISNETNQEVGRRSQYYLQAEAEFYASRWQYVRRPTFEDLVERNGGVLPSSDVEFAEMVLNHSDHLYDYIEALEDLTATGNYQDIEAQGFSDSQWGWYQQVLIEFQHGVTFTPDQVKRYFPTEWAQNAVLRVNARRETAQGPDTMAMRINREHGTDLNPEDLVEIWIKWHTGEIARGEFTSEVAVELVERVTEQVNLIDTRGSRTQRELYDRNLHDELINQVIAKWNNVPVDDVVFAQQIEQNIHIDVNEFYDSEGNLNFDVAIIDLNQLALADEEFSELRTGYVQPEQRQEYEDERRTNRNKNFPDSPEDAVSEPGESYQAGQGRQFARDQLETQLEQAQDELATARQALVNKRRELDQRIADEQPNLFGERPRDQEARLLDIPADLSQRQPALQPFIDRVDVATQRVQSIRQQIQNLPDQSDPTLFDQVQETREESGPGIIQDERKGYINHPEYGEIGYVSEAEQGDLFTRPDQTEQPLEPTFWRRRREWTTSRQWQLTGARDKIESIDDVAEMFRMLETESVEHLFVVYELQDGSFVAQHISSGAPTATVSDNNAVFAGLQKYKPRKMYFIHNHPSGTMRPSTADFTLAGRYDQIAGDNVEVQGIIIDAGRNEYVQFSPRQGRFSPRNTSINPFSPPQRMADMEFDVQYFNRQVFNEDVNTALYESVGQVNSEMNVAQFISAYKLSFGDKLTAILVDPSMNVDAVYPIQYDNLNEIGRFIDSIVAKHGTGRLILAGRHENTITDMARINDYTKAEVLDVIQFDWNNDNTSLRTDSYSRQTGQMMQSDRLIMEGTQEYGVTEPGRTEQLQEELTELMQEWDRMSRGQLGAGLDPRLVAQSARIIAKGFQLGYSKFSDFANYVIDNYGADYWNKIFTSMRTAYIAHVKRTGQGDPTEIDGLRSMTAQDFINEGQQEQADTAQEGEQQPGDDFEVTDEPTVPANPDAMQDQTYFEVFRRFVQDRFFGLRRMQEQAEEQSGERLTDEQNPYQKEELYTGKVEFLIEGFKEEYEDKLINLIHSMGWTLEQADLYLMARHAKERNDHIASINEKMPDGGSGMFNDDARQILDDVAGSDQAQQAEELGALWDSAMAYQRELWRSSGLLDERAIEAMENKYDHYIALRTGEAGRSMMGRGFDPRRTMQRALGRTTVADNAIVESLAQVRKDIVRAEKAVIGRALLEFVEGNPNPDMYQVNVVKYKNQWDKKTGTVKRVKDTSYESNDNVVPVVTKDGKVKHITFFSERGIAFARNYQNIGPENKGVIVSALHSVNRYLATVNTGLNPEFVISNFFRDVQTAAVNLSSTEADELRGKIIKDVGPAVRGMYQFLGGNIEGNEWAGYAQEFVEAGGKTGWIDAYAETETFANNIRKELERLDRSGADPRELVNKLGNWLQKMNDSVENGVRLSTFINARRAGISVDKSASLAKNITVNFNRRGEFGIFLNSLYLFYGASTQGTVRVLQAMKSRKGQKIIGGMLAGSILNDLVQRLIGGFDDDEIAYYDKIPNWVKERNLILMLPGMEGRYLTVPLPYGYNVVNVVGQEMGGAISNFMFGEPIDYDYAESALNIANSAFGAFNPIGGGDWAQFVTPTFGDPFVQVATNKNWAGEQIYPTGNPFDRSPPPASQQYFRTAPEWAVNLSEELNDITGGTDAEPGLLDYSPNVYEHFIQFVLGGAGNFVNETYDSTVKTIKRKQLEPYQIPMVGKLYGKVSDYNTYQKYTEFMKSIDYANDNLELAKENKDRAEYNRIREDREVYLRSTSTAEAVETEIRKLRKQRNALDERVERGELTDLDIADRRRELNNEMTKLRKELVRTVHKHMRKQRESND
jgi:hypothetical protein